MRSSSLNTVGARGEEQDLIKRIAGKGFGRDDFRRIWCMVGTAVYQFAL